MRKIITGAVLSVAMSLSAMSGVHAAALPGLQTEYDAVVAACVPVPTPACNLALQAYLAAAAQAGFTIAQAVAGLEADFAGNTAVLAAVEAAAAGSAAGPVDGSPG